MALPNNTALTEIVFSCKTPLFTKQTFLATIFRYTFFSSGWGGGGVGVGQLIDIFSPIPIDNT